jgi:hypothetical protein
MGCLPILEGTSSNAHFRQLLAVGLVKDERVFQIGSAATRADNDWSTDETAIAKGECNLGYIPSTNGPRRANQPLVLGPMLPGRLKFDPVPLAGHAVILRTDGSATTHPIDENGDVIVDGKNLFDPEQPFWNGQKPEVALPE